MKQDTRQAGQRRAGSQRSHPDQTFWLSWVFSVSMSRIPHRGEHPGWPAPAGKYARPARLVSPLGHGKQGREMTIPMAEFEDFDSPTSGLDGLPQGIAADAAERGPAVLLPSPIDRLRPGRFECPARPRKALSFGR
jgi:hypothetical protein